MSTQPRARTPVRADRAERVFAGVVAFGSIAVLLVALWLKPATEGHGTHQQLGLNPCAWVMLFDQPCPTCGMTTSFAHAARADLIGAFQAQPLGALMAVLTAAAFWVGLHVALTGSTIGRAFAGLLGPRLLWTAMAALLAAWVYKIMTWPGL